MATPSPREKRMGQDLTRNLADDPNAAIEPDEELVRRQERNLREWQLAFAGAKTPKQREVLLAELEDRQGIDFPGHARASTGFQPVPLADTAPKGFQPVQLPKPADPLSSALRRLNEQDEAIQNTVGRELRTPDAISSEMQAREALPGSGVNRTPVIGFGETPGGAATGIQTPRVAGDDVQAGGPGARLAAETGGAFLGGLVGSVPGRVTRSPGLTTAGMRAGEAGGAFLGSLFSEAFDPTEKPLETAGIAAGWTAASGAASELGGSIFRRMLGKPTEAGQHLIKIMEKEGKVPVPGAVLPETSIAQTIQSIGSAEAFFGRNVKKHVEETGMAASRELRHYIADFYRYKKGADKAFKEWDQAMESMLLKEGSGSYRPVHVKPEVFDALDTAVKEWDRLGLTSQVDNTLLAAIKHAQVIRAQAAEAGQKIAAINLTISEAEAARTFLYNRARAMAGSSTAEKGAIGGDDFARAYRKMAEGIAGGIDDAIDTSVKNGKIPAELRARLEGGRALYKQWKQGEAIMDELAIPVRAAGRREGPLRAQKIETAINNIEREERVVGRPVISTTQKAHLAGIQRALKAAEESGKSSAFTLAVRTGQLATLTYGSYQSGGDIGGIAGSAALALSPAAFTFLVTNPKAASLLIRGLRLDPGAAQGARLFRELTTLMAKNGFADIEREPRDEE